MYFNESTHTYIHKVTGEIYPSVTTVLSKYKNKFDSVPISEKFVIDHPELNNDYQLRKYLDKLVLLNKDVKDVPRPITPEIIRQLWEESSVAAQIKGKGFHFDKEITTIYNNTNLPIDYNDSIVDLHNLSDGYYPELRVWNDYYKIAGMVDKVKIIKPNIWITDYKTNKKEITKGDRFSKKLKYPLSFLNDSSYYIYEQQLNIYGFLFETWGYKVQGLELIHKRFLDNDIIPENYINGLETIEEIKKPKTIQLMYFPVRTRTFLEYDLKNR